MSGLQDRGVMTIRAAAIPMPIMLSGIVIIVLVREAVPGCPSCMTGSTLRIDVYGADPPVGRGLAAVTLDAGAGTVTVIRSRAALGIKAGRETEIRSAVLMS